MHARVLGVSTNVVSIDFGSVHYSQVSDEKSPSSPVDELPNGLNRQVLHRGLFIDAGKCQW